MIKHNEFQQGSLAWLEFRAGKPTASEFSNLVTPKFEIRKGQMVESYLALKVAELWLGGAIADIGSFAMEQGSLIEDEVKPWWTLETGQEIESVGLITTDCGRVACSPDGLIGDSEGIEIKAPQPVNAVKYLLKGELPDDYVLQVQGSMWVTGFKTWKFVSYHRRFPALVLTVERDEKAQLAIGEALALFCERLDRAYEHVVELNHGPPFRSAIPTSKPEFEQNMNDVPS